MNKDTKSRLIWYISGIVGYIVLIVGVPALIFWLSSLTDHDTPQMSSPPTRVTYDELVRQGSYNLVRQVFLTWEAEYAGGDGAAVVGAGALDEEEAARLRVPGDMQKRFEEILSRYRYEEQRFAPSREEMQKKAVARIAFGGGERYESLLPEGAGGWNLEGIEAYVLEGNEAYIVTRDRFDTDIVYTCGDAQLAEDLRRLVENAVQEDGEADSG